MANDDFDKGFAARAAMFGKDKAERALNQGGQVAAKFQRLMTTYCFGALWADDAISGRDRSLITMSLLAAQGKADELRVHVGLAIKNGVEVAVLVEVAQHVAVYCGIPSGALASRIIQEVIDQVEK